MSLSAEQIGQMVADGVKQGLQSVVATQNTRGIPGLSGSPAQAGALNPEQSTEFKQRMVPHRTAHQRVQSGLKIVEETSDQKLRGISVAAIVRATAIRARFGGDIVDILGSLGHEEHAHRIYQQRAALTVGSLADGGALVPEEYAAEVIPALRAKAVWRNFGPTMLPLANGNLTVPKQTGTSTASWVGETQNITPSKQSTGQVKLSSKKLGVVTPISNDLLRIADARIDAMVRDDIVRVAALKDDYSIMYGAGTQYTPAGLRKLMSSANSNAATNSATPTQAQVDGDLSGKLIGKVEDANVDLTPDNGVFAMAPRTKRFLMDLKNANGIYVYRDEMSKGTLRGYRYAVTTQIPADDTSSIFFGAIDELVIGDETGMEIEVGQNVTYWDGSQLVSGFSADQTAIRLIMKTDYQLRHDLAFAELTAVKWGS